MVITQKFELEKRSITKVAIARKLKIHERSLRNYFSCQFRPDNLTRYVTWEAIEKHILKNQ